MRCLVAGLAFALTYSLLAPSASAADPVKKPTYDDPAQVDADFALQGEYQGTVQRGEGTIPLGIQVIARGDGKFTAVGHHGGLPDDPKRESHRREAQGTLKDGAVTFNDGWTATLKGDEITITTDDGKTLGTLKKTLRTSPTQGEKPPAGAIVLFDGSSVDAFPGAKMTEDKLLTQGATSKQKFQNHRLHIEFRTPYQPFDAGQGRGNSGVYLQGRYEVQVLDSFGLLGKNNECGGIYTIAEPAVNMCYPPLSWQTYDIDYTAAIYDGEKKTKNARITVKHNGVTIHDDVELPKGTTAAPVKEGSDAGPLYLQNHGNPVRYRNIWVVEK
ncbi:MAG: DUF1080 domain-containing protein [Pirellulales bacterium]